jgi:hypothetical protein
VLQAGSGIMPRLILGIVEELNMSTPMLLDPYGYILMRLPYFHEFGNEKSIKETLTKNKVPV